jgi:Topoisomerase IA
MVEFDWDKKHLFEKQKAEELYEKCMTNPEAKVILVKEQEKFKTRPLPLSTVSLQKIATSKLGLPSHKVMEAADKLYNKGFISYPRTETDLFVNTINLTGLLRTHKDHPEWGPYVNKLLEGGKFKWPRDGGHNDNAHPPIHPVKMVIKEQASNFTPEEWKVYELITRHFLACCSQDAVGSETQIKIDIQGETFTAKGLVVKERNWLEVYPYEKWSNSTVPKFAADEIFKPTDISLKESKTSPPHLLTENELISLMDKNGIGTDATIHEHIKTIQERAYALKTGNHFQPTKLGEALVTAYENMGIDLWKPTLRASMEASMTQIAKGLMKKETFLEECLTQMEKIFAEVKQKQHLMIEALKQYYTFGGDRRVGSRTHLDLPDLNDINRSDQKEGSSTTTTSQQAQDKTPVQAKSASSKSKSAQEKTNNVLSTEEEGSEETAKPKKRGRPKKNTTVVAEKNDSKSLENAIQADENGTPQKKKRTRRTKTSEEDNSLKVEEQSAAEVKKGEEKVSKVDQSKEKIWNYKKLLEDELDSIGNNVKKSAMSQKTRSKSAEKSKKSDSSVLDEIPENKSKIFVRKRNLILQKAK